MTFNLEEFRAGMESKYGPNWREKMREFGSEGGKAKVSKGFGRMDPQRLREVSSKGGSTPRRTKNGN